jgi:FemAB-related protein (PEP-CTERM system-associated)
LLKVINAGEADSACWDFFVRSHDSAAPYHLYGWRRVIERSYGLSPFYLMVVDEKGAPQGVLPLFETKRVFGGRGACSIPFCNHAGVLADSEEAENLLLEEVRKLAAGRAWKSVQLRMLDKPKGPYKVNLSHVTQVVQLPDDPKVFSSSLNRKLRWMTRVAPKAEITTSFDKKKLDDFYRVYSENMRDLGTPSHSCLFFRQVLEVFPDETGLIMLHKGKEPVGGMLTFRFKDMITDPWASSLRKYFELYPNYLLYWEAFHHAISVGVSCFDMGRSQPGSGTFKFKAKWGAVTHPLYYVELLEKGGGGWEEKKNSLERISNLYKLFPLSVSRGVGPHLRKFLP